MTGDRGDGHVIVGSGGAVRVDRLAGAYCVLIAVVDLSGHAVTVALPLPEDARALAAALDEATTNPEAARARRAVRLLAPRSEAWR